MNIRNLGRHGTYSVPLNTTLTLGLSKKAISTEQDLKVNRLEVDRELSYRDSVDDASSLDRISVITDKMKNMTTDEIFDRLIKENVDFRDIRYKELYDQFDEEMNLFNKNAPSFDDLSEVMSSGLLNQTQVYSSLQTKFYNLRNRDKKDIQERFERVVQVVRDSHSVEIQNVMNKFKGLLKETIQKKLDEQKLKLEQENKDIRENYYSMKFQIKNLEEKCESLQEKINERDRRLQETYDKIMKINNENSCKNADQEKLQKIIKEKDQQIERYQKAEKSIEELNKLKIDFNLLVQEKDKIIIQKENVIQKLQKQLEQLNSKINNQDQKIKSFEFDSNKDQSRKSFISDEGVQDSSNKEKAISPEQSYMACKQNVLRFESKSGGYSSSNTKSRNGKQQPLQQSLPASNFGDILEIINIFLNRFRKYKKAQREENVSNRQQIDQLNQQIKLKEDQVKLLQAEVMGLKEESSTYLQNLQSIQQQQIQSQGSKTQGLLNTCSPNINDQILEPLRRQETSANKSRLSMTEDNRQLQNTFTKNASQFHVTISPKLVKLNSVSSRNRNLSINAENNKENLSKSRIPNTSDLTLFKKQPKGNNPNNNSCNQRQSLLNITNKGTSPDPSKKFCDNYYQNNTPIIQNKVKITQVQSLLQNTNLLSNNTSNSQYFNNNLNSAQQLFSQATSPLIGNRSINIASFNNFNSNLTSINNMNNSIQSPTMIIHNNTQKQKKLLGSYRIQSSYSTQQGSNSGYLQTTSDSFIPLNL